MTKRTKGPEESVDQQGQCSRWNCLLIDGVEENSNGDTDKLENVVNDDPEIDLMKVGIDRTHYIGDSKKKRKNTRPIIVKLSSLGRKN